jgi:NADH:ubiquinone oxidoreductase subunit E
MDEPTSLTICLGSSCFTRGNDENLPRIQAYLKAKGLEDRVALKGSRCEGRCQHGPNLRVGEAFIEEVRAETLLEKLEKAL